MNVNAEKATKPGSPDFVAPAEHALQVFRCYCRNPACAFLREKCPHGDLKS